VDILVVGESEVVRHTGRLASTLSPWFSAEFCTPDEFESLVPSLRRAGVIFIGESRLSSYLRPVVPAVYCEHGVCWGIRDRKALIYTEAPPLDRTNQVQVMEAAIDECREQTRSALVVHRRTMTTNAPNGMVMAGLYLDPDNEAARRFPLPAPTSQPLPLRVRDRQLVLGIAQFLQRGFDPVVAETQLPAPERRAGPSRR